MKLTRATINTADNTHRRAMQNLKTKKSEETRSKIIRAFETCIATNGYAQTKLMDIADEAGLATPHLRYYFKNKESILEHRYEQLVAGFDRALITLEADDALGWFEKLAALVFGDERRSPQAVIVLIEGNGLAARSEQMRDIKQQYDVQTRTIFAAKIRELGCANAEESAEVVFHFLTGLILNTAFGSQAARRQAIPLFLRFVRSLV